MKKIITICILFLAAGISIFCITQTPAGADKFQSGDIIFIVSASGQGKAIQLATKSKYTHVGIVFKEGGKTFVYHAVEPVKKSTLEEFMEYSSDGQYVVKRLKPTNPLNEKNNQQMLALANKLVGKHYDIYFNWSDDEIYCSELVWKLYKQSYGLEIGKLRPLKDFDLSSKEVKYIMEKRYGDHIPLNEQMISPGDMFNSDLLESVLVE